MNQSVDGPRGGYYSHISDLTQTQSAQRSDFRPTLTNRYTNWLAKSANPKVQAFGRFVDGMRNADLGARSMVADGRAMAARTRIGLAERLDGLRPSVRKDADLADSMAQTRTGQRTAIDLKYGFKRERYQHKREIGRQARAGELEAGVEEANQKFARHLEGKGYRPLDMSGAIMPNYRSNYLTSPDGYAIRMGYDRPSPFATTTAAQVNRQFENGVTGSERQMRSLYQHMKLGVHNAALWAEEQANASRARKTDLAPARRDHFMMTAQEAKAQRAVNRAALKGEHALSMAAYEADEERRRLVTSLRNRRPGDAYDERPAANGVAPPTVSRVAERAQAYSDAHHGKPVDSRRIKWMSGIANAWGDARAKRHERKAGDYEVRLRSMEGQEANALREKMDMRKQQAVNERARIASRKSALQGKLYENLQQDLALDEHHPRLDTEEYGFRAATTWDSEQTRQDMSEIPADLAGGRTLAKTLSLDGDELGLSEEERREWAQLHGADGQYAFQDSPVSSAGVTPAVTPDPERTRARDDELPAGGLRPPPPPLPRRDGEAS